MKLFRRVFLLPLVLLLGGLVAACVTSGPQKALNDVADALSKNDGAAFLAQLDMMISFSAGKRSRRVVGSSVAKSLFSASTSERVSVLSRVDLPALV